MKRIFQRYPFFLIFLPLFIVLHIEKRYDHLINYQFITKEVLILFIAPLLVYLIALALLKQMLKANLLSFIMLFFFYFSGEVKDSLKATWPGSTIQSHSFLWPTIILIISISYFAIKRKNITSISTYFLNSATLLFVIIDTVGLLLPSSTRNQQNTSFNTSLCKKCERPDIYYIIFDSYTSGNPLRTEFEYDNSPIENFLIENGFKIIKDSRSNYNLTPFSIGSIFNMEYLNHVDTSHVLRLKDYLPAVNKVYYTGLFPAMERMGYKIYNHSIFDFKNHPSSVPAFDIWKTKKIYQQFNIIKKTYNEIGWNLPSWMNLNFGKPDDYLSNRDKHDSIALRHLLNTIQDSLVKPKFVYTHFLLPHDPYSFDSSGNKIRLPYNLTREKDKHAYIQQLVYANKIMMQIVETIHSRSKGKAMIIIQGDHGYRNYNKLLNQYEFSNLSTFYFPGKDYRLLNDSSSSVNTFRIMLNTFFRQNYPILPTKTYFLKHQQ